MASDAFCEIGTTEDRVLSMFVHTRIPPKPERSWTNAAMTLLPSFIICISFREVKTEVKERWSEKSSLSFSANGAVQQSADQPENASYNEIECNDIAQ